METSAAAIEGSIMQAGQTVLSLRPGGGGGGGGNRVSRVLASSLSSDLPLLRPHGAAPPPSRSLKVGTFPLSLSLSLIRWT